MRCTLAKNLIPLFVSDDLPDEQMFSLREHLEACATCRQLAAEYSENQFWLRTFAAPQFPEAIFDDLRNDLQKEIAKTEPRSGWFERLIPRWDSTTAIATAAAVAVLIATVGIYIWRSQPDRSSPIVAKDNENRMKDNPTKEEGRDQSSYPNRTVSGGRRKPSGPSVNRRSPKPKSFRLPIPQHSPAQTDVATTDIPGDQEMLRIELQTADPNIRIIWLTPKHMNSPSDTVNTNR